MKEVISTLYNNLVDWLWNIPNSIKCAVLGHIRPRHGFFTLYGQVIGECPDCGKTVCAVTHKIRPEKEGENNYQNAPIIKTNE